MKHDHSRRDDIDGLRAVAVLAVIAFHLGLPGISGGFVGVDVFFVISGYLITRIIVSDLQTNEFSFWEFYTRRVRRIFPALAVMVAVCLVVGTIIMLPSDLASLGNSGIAAVLGVSNWYFYFNTGYFDQAAGLTPLLHTWSLGVEEQFYFAWPALVYFAFRTKRVFLIIAITALLSFAWNVVSIAPLPKQGFYLPFTRAWELCLGGMLVFLPPVRQRWVGFLGLAAISFSAAFLTSDIPFPGAAALPPCLGAAAVIASPIGTLGWRPLAWLGRISYSLYLWHWPVLVFFAYRMGHPPGGALELASVSLAILVISVLSWRFVEVPVLRVGKAAKPQLVVGVTGVVGSGLLLLAGFLVYSGGVPQRFSAQELALINDQPIRGVVNDDGRSCSSRSADDPCLLGDRIVAPSWALVGDSHAETLMSSVDEAWTREGVAGYVFTRPGCPFIVGANPTDNSADCASFVGQVIAELKRLNVEQVIIQDRANAYILGSRFDNEEGGIEPGGDISVAVGGADGADRVAALEVALGKTIDEITSAGIRVYYLLSPPEVGWNAPVRALEAMRTESGPVTTSLDVYLRRNAGLMRVLAHKAGPNVSIIPSYKAFCDSSSRRCAVTDSNGVLYTDTDHLSARGAAKLTDLLFTFVPKQQAI